MKKIVFIILLLLPLAVFSQEVEDKYSIGGQLRIAVLTEIRLPSDYNRIWIEDTDLSVVTDSSGIFRFDNLEKGKYHIIVKGLGCKTDTVVEIVDKSLSDIVLIAKYDCEVNSANAEKDIRDNEVKLLIMGGYAPKKIRDKDHKFEEKFNLKYYQYGCLAPEIECLIEYNRHIFEYLDSRYGKSWRKSVRKDVPGFKEYRKK
ncbi:carboxypeptidase-like regulatory domain-containing protein [Dysgonomonas sp. 25]|uniref:carboxypeptidase-like regulatory domain-containing protein n=1 Tax=Dysgonomonas sp. 25 TaxID=2302933 RepID=UPI0013D1E4FB|nr:carboxypeptidase-like regulatory domain-containing protein [Dysgonomonas sp. 25]NDV69284.1 hypothetical protein [Dysgonomonas sp. 25]